MALSVQADADRGECFWWGKKDTGADWGTGSGEVDNGEGKNHISYITMVTHP